MIDVEDIIRATARTAAIDPDVALAVARQESSLNPYARGDRRGTYGISGTDPRAVDDFCSFGLYQENVCGGAGETHLRRGGAFADLLDPVGATVRFAERYRAAAQSFVGAPPGRIAAEAQRPYDREGYARSVDAMLADRTEPAPPSATEVVPECPMGYTYDPATRSCKSWVPGGIVPNVPPGKFLPPRAGGGSGITLPWQPGGGISLPNPLEGVAAAIESARQGAAQLAIGGAVIGVALLLGYAGLKKTID